MLSLINYAFNPLLFIKNTYCSSKYRFAFYVGKITFALFIINILKMSAKVHCRAPGRRVYVWIHTFLLLLLGWGYYTHLVYKNQQATIFY